MGSRQAVQATPGGRPQSHYAQLVSASENGAPRHPGTPAGPRRRRAHAHSAAPRPLLNIAFHVLLVVGATGSPPAPGRCGRSVPARRRWRTAGLAGPGRA